MCRLSLVALVQGLLALQRGFLIDVASLIADLVLWGAQACSCGMWAQQLQLMA